MYKIDANKITVENVKEIGAGINEYISHNPDRKRIFLDLANIEYISSAGIRLLMMTAKDNSGPVSVFNVSQQVRDILTVTGVDTVLNVHSEFRTLNTEGCKRLGNGWYGTVYRLDEDKIVKIYNDNPINTLENIENERDISRKMYLKGIPCAAVYDIIKTSDGHLGVIYEFMSGKTIGELLREHPDSIEKYAVVAADLLRLVHGTKVEDRQFPSCRESLGNMIENSGKKLSEEDAGLIYEFLDRFSEHEYLLHGDFNMGNIMINEDSGVLIDVGGAYLGHPAIEIGQKFPFELINPGYAETEEAKKNPNVIFYRKFIESYFSDVPGIDFIAVDERLKTVAAFIILFNYYTAREQAADAGTYVDFFRAYFKKTKDELYSFDKWWVV